VHSIREVKQAKSGEKEGKAKKWKGKSFNVIKHSFILSLHVHQC
jgi:hypothetical protein